MDERSDALRTLVNASGFVFQIAVEQTVRDSAGRHDWRVDAREYPWRTSRREGFADLVLAKGPFVLVVECKRQRNSEWVFLMPDPEQLSRSHARIRWTNTVPHRPPLSDWDDVQIYPSSSESEFCVVRGHTDKDRPMLERMAGEVIESVEGVSADFLKIHEQSASTHVIVPLIVTNASLYLCRFNPKQVNLSRGELPTADFERVGSVRFRKSLAPTTEPDYWEPEELKHLSIGSERTVFVVNAAEVPAWLGGFEMGHSPGAMPWESARERSNAEF